MSLLATVAELSTFIEADPPLEDDDSYYVMILTMASEAVRDAAERPDWVRENPSTGQTLAPVNAHHVTLWVAQRASEHPGNLSRRTSGPVSESFFENGVYGLDLTAGELARLRSAAGSTKSGLWAQPITAGGAKVGREAFIRVGTYPSSGQFHIATEGEWPYNIPEA